MVVIVVPDTRVKTREECGARAPFVRKPRTTTIRERYCRNPGIVCVHKRYYTEFANNRGILASSRYRVRWLNVGIRLIINRDFAPHSPAAACPGRRFSRTKIARPRRACLRETYRRRPVREKNKTNERVFEYKFKRRARTYTHIRLVSLLTFCFYCTCPSLPSYLLFINVQREKYIDLNIALTRRVIIRGANDLFLNSPKRWQAPKRLHRSIIIRTR